MTGNGNKFEKCFEVAKRGDVAAMKSLGDCYMDGVGVEKDVVQAAEWYRKAADQGYAEAQWMLGCCYHNGRGVEKNE
ncbi:MAG: sel1 repeat family protein, partial [Kiritimatiellae bacterium]|nr:sel1 repeat family protein [Kiritimatiellia bacterium]